MTTDQLQFHQEQMEAARAEFSRLYPNVRPQDEMRLWNEFLTWRTATQGERSDSVNIPLHCEKIFSRLKEGKFSYKALRMAASQLKSLSKGQKK